MNLQNLFKISDFKQNTEQSETLTEGKEIIIERIISTGQITPDNEWYDQEKDEWVALLQGEAEIHFEKNDDGVKMKSGDHILIPAHSRHKVTFTSIEPPCIWLAVHFKK